MDPVACRVIPAADLPSDLPDPATIQGLVAFDTETSALHPDPPEFGRVSAVSLAWYDPELDAIVAGAYPFGQGIADDRADLGPTEWRTLCRWLAEAGGGLVGHNSKFDIVMMHAGSVGGYPGVDLNDRIVWDTMIAAREMWPQTSAALKSLAVLMFDEDADAEQQALAPYLGPKKDPRYDLVPWEVMRPYAVQDAVLTTRLLHKQWSLVEQGLEGTRYIGQEIDISKALARMEFAGIPYDPEISRAQGEVLQREIDRLSAELPFLPTLPKAKVFFFGNEPRADLGRGVVECQCRVPYSLTDKGQPSLDAEALDQMVRESVPYAREYQTIQRFKSAVSKWYTPFADRCGPDGRLRTQFRQVASGSGDVGGTKSGRFSAGRINLQAVPKDYALHLPVMTPRQVIGAAADALDGWALWELDLAQAELRTAALDAGCTKMLDLIVAGEDTHGATATELFGTRPGDPEFKVHRQIAKRANFSLIFGSGVKTFRAMIHKEAGQTMSESEATRVVYGWRDLYPEFGRRIDYCMDHVDRTGYIELTNGKRRYYGKREDSHSAFNQRIQGSLAEYAKAWLLHTDRELRPLRERGVAEGVGPGGLVLVVHDSQVLLLPEDEGPEIVDAICRAAEGLWAQWFPGVPGGVDAERWGA